MRQKVFFDYFSLVAVSRWLQMSTNLTSNWEPVRINPETKARLQAILDKAGDGGAMMRRINEVLEEAVAQIESGADRLPTLPTVKRLREALGRYSGTEFKEDFAARLDELEKKYAALKNAADGDGLAARVAEQPARAKAKRKRS